MGSFRLKDKSRLNLVGLPKESIVYALSYLDATDLVKIGLTCCALGKPSKCSSESVVASVARGTYCRTVTGDDEIALAVKETGESPLKLLRDLEELHSPLQFSRLVGPHIRRNQNTICSEIRSTGYYESMAFTNYKIHREQQYFNFLIHDKDSQDVSFSAGMPRVGLMRPIIGLGRTSALDPLVPCEDAREYLLSCRKDSWGTGSVHCTAWDCLHNALVSSDWSSDCDPFGSACHNHWNADTGNVGLLVDMEEGTMSVYCNGRPLQLVTRGLTGEYYLFASMFEPDIVVSIDRAPIPAHKEK